MLTTYSTLSPALKCERAALYKYPRLDGNKTESKRVFFRDGNGESKIMLFKLRDIF